MHTMVNGYGVAQICREGHIANPAMHANPSRNKAHCTTCGAETISTCQSCTKPIRGAYCSVRYGAVQVNPLVKAPAFCEHCGAPFPWTESRLDAANDLADQLGLDIPERTLLEKSIEELVRDTPRAPAEAVRFKGIVTKAQPWALGAFKEILYGVVGETAKRMIWPA
jgi:hypothetical protein